MRTKKKVTSFEQVISRQLKDPEMRLLFDEKKFFLQVARLIRSLREKNCLSQTDLAKAAKISQPLLARLETGDQSRTPTFTTISKILKALGYRLELKIIQENKKAA